ncbi:MAG: sodium:calcium antiporter [Alphaproteobacteria bacterium]|nr:sodium:calcium antiporter [Alphaproteobacteria bacterium]
MLILLGTEAAMRGAVGIARSLDMSPLVIGVLIIAPAASAPDLAISVRAATMNFPDIALGGIIGTCMLNLLFILGFGALLRPLASPPKVVFRDGGAMLLGAGALALYSAGGTISWQEGVLLLAAFLLYLALLVVTDWRRAPDHSVPQSRALYYSEGASAGPVGGSFLLLLGIVLIILGAHFLVGGSEVLARQFHWERSFVGLTLVGFAMSFPKLIATVAAAARGQASIAVGQLIGANVFALLGVLGITALVKPLAVPNALASVDVLVLAIATAAVLPVLAMRWRLSRPRGLLLMIAYGGYFAYVLWRQGLMPALPYLG